MPPGWRGGFSLFASSSLLFLSLYIFLFLSLFKVCWFSFFVFSPWGGLFRGMHTCMCQQLTDKKFNYCASRRGVNPTGGFRRPFPPQTPKKDDRRKVKLAMQKLNISVGLIRFLFSGGWAPL